MADIEDEAEFGSHFLDSMLEVEMTEDDNELDVSKNCDPLETLPPVPTFDLQSETLSYKDVYKNSIPQPVLATLPLPDASKVPAVLNPASVLVLSGEPPAQKPVSVRTIVSKISAKPSAKSLLKTAATNTQPNETTNGKFIEEVFRPDFVKNVFVEADTHTDISLVSEEEMKYYKTCFKGLAGLNHANFLGRNKKLPSADIFNSVKLSAVDKVVALKAQEDVSNVKNCRLHCTICDKHLGCAMSVEKKINVHSMLKVLTCKPCYEFYGDGNFPCDVGDNCEIYCRWCGQGGALVCCSFCPKVFCKKCVKRNYGPSFLKSIEKASDWACFCCAQKPLWPHRAICRALLEYFAQRKTDPKTSPKDTTSCCKGPGLARKRLRGSTDKNDLPATPLSQPKTLQIKNKSSPSVKQSKGHFLFTPPIKPKTPDTPRSLSTRASKPAATSTPNVFSPRSILTGNAIIRGLATSSPSKFISSLPTSQLLQSPVLHGETLITPPPRLLLQAKSRPTLPAPPNASIVRVSLTNQTPNLDLTKVPTVKIPHEVQGLVLRLIFPDNRIQYVRLTSDGAGCKAGKEFPMPQFPQRGGCFVEENLAEAFKVCKTMYEKLSRIREKVNSRTKFTEESVINSSVKKLHLAYEKTVDLFKELDRTLTENQAQWKKGGSLVDVIDISDDEGAATKKAKVERADRASRYSALREKCRTFNVDSDIEILEDVAVNGNTAATTNYKEKYRLRRNPVQAMKESSDEGTPKKRKKKGRPRKYNRRPWVSRMHNGRPDETADEKSEETTDEKSKEEGGGKSEQTTDDKLEEAVDGKSEETVEGKSKEEVDGRMDLELAAEKEPEEVIKPGNQTICEADEGAKEGDAAPGADSIQQET